MEYVLNHPLSALRFVTPTPNAVLGLPPFLNLSHRAQGVSLEMWAVETGYVVFAYHAYSGFTLAYDDEESTSWGGVQVEVLKTPRFGTNH
jgi:hypothetical protein